MGRAKLHLLSVVPEEQQQHRSPPAPPPHPPPPPPLRTPRTPLLSLAGMEQAVPSPRPVCGSHPGPAAAVDKNKALPALPRYKEHRLDTPRVWQVQLQRSSSVYSRTPSQCEHYARRGVGRGERGAGTEMLGTMQRPYDKRRTMMKTTPLRIVVPNEDRNGDGESVQASGIVHVDDRRGDEVIREKKEKKKQQRGPDLPALYIVRAQDDDEGLLMPDEAGRRPGPISNPEMNDSRSSLRPARKKKKKKKNVQVVTKSTSLMPVGPVGAYSTTNMPLSPPAAVDAVRTSPVSPMTMAELALDIQRHSRLHKMPSIRGKHRHDQVSQQSSGASKSGWPYVPDLFHGARDARKLAAEYMAMLSPAITPRSSRVSHSDGRHVHFDSDDARRQSTSLACDKEMRVSFCVARSAGLVKGMPSVEDLNSIFSLYLGSSHEEQARSPSSGDESRGRYSRACADRTAMQPALGRSEQHLSASREQVLKQEKNGGNQAISRRPTVLRALVRSDGDEEVAQPGLFLCVPIVAVVDEGAEDQAPADNAVVAVLEDSGQLSQSSRGEPAAASIEPATPISTKFLADYIEHSPGKPLPGTGSQNEITPSETASSSSAPDAAAFSAGPMTLTTINADNIKAVTIRPVRPGRAPSQTPAADDIILTRGGQIRRNAVPGVSYKPDLLTPAHVQSYGGEDIIRTTIVTLDDTVISDGAVRIPLKLERPPPPSRRRKDKRLKRGQSSASSATVVKGPRRYHGLRYFARVVRMLLFHQPRSRSVRA